ncbi:hypothetical protein FSP39_022657 [Pinctada imbricata]|uniref:OTU domain-containing protein n=1 Tax=Pinctada imbricata TaxID=66713 RepID=A0AA89C4B3_PINIB|nr:hypothetical protein FSP39_022657 [Pinctada imbricata]
MNGILKRRIFSPVSTSWKIKTCEKLSIKPYIGEQNSYNLDESKEQDLVLGKPLEIYQTKGDGNCFFRALAFVISGDEENHMCLREHITKYISKNKDENGKEICRFESDKYLQNSGMQILGTWATDIEIMFAASFLQTSLFVYSKYGKKYDWLEFKPHTLRSENAENIYLQHTNLNHYDVVIKTQPVVAVEETEMSIDESIHISDDEQLHMDVSNEQNESSIDVENLSFHITSLRSPTKNESLLLKKALTTIPIDLRKARDCKDYCLYGIDKEDMKRARIKFWSKTYENRVNWFLDKIGEGVKKNGTLKYVVEGGRKICGFCLKCLYRIDKNFYYSNIKKSRQGVQGAGFQKGRGTAQTTEKAVTWLENYAYYHADKMPMNEDLLLPYKTRKIDIYHKYKDDMTESLERSVGQSGFYDLWKTKFKHLKIKQVGSLPEILYVQADNCARENKNKFVLAFCELLVRLSVFREVHLSFLQVGHTHEDIDAAFSRISEKLRKTDAETLPRLQSVVGGARRLGGLYDIKTWLAPWINDIEHHSKPLHYKFSRDHLSKVIVKYRSLSTKPWKQGDESILKKTPVGQPSILVPPNFHKVDEVLVKGNILKHKFSLSQEQHQWWHDFIGKLKRLKECPIERQTYASRNARWVLPLIAGVQDQKIKREKETVEEYLTEMVDKELDDHKVII